MAAGTGRKSAAGEDSRVIRTRADVGRTALDVLVTEGSDALTHARVAELAGYSKTTLYSHWPTRFDLLKIALDAIGELPHQEPTGDLRADLIGELTSFRQAVVDLHIDRVLSAMAQWASVDEMAGIRDASTPRRSARSARCSRRPSTAPAWRRRSRCWPEWWRARR